MSTRITLLLICIFWSLTAYAQNQEAGDTNDAASEASTDAQANNPLANFSAFNLHNYYIPELSGPVDETANSFILRYAKPIGNWLLRASLPFNRTPTGINSTTSGLGDRGDMDAARALLPEIVTRDRDLETGADAERLLGDALQSRVDIRSEYDLPTDQYRRGKSS